MRLIYNEWSQHFAEVPTIFLNGIAMTGVIEADEEAGHILVYDTNEKGGYLYDGNGNFRRRKITGRVSIEGKPKPPAPEPTEIDYTSFCGFWKEPHAFEVVSQEETFKILGADLGERVDFSVIAVVEFNSDLKCWTLVGFTEKV